MVLLILQMVQRLIQNQLCTQTPNPNPGEINPKTLNPNIVKSYLWLARNEGMEPYSSPYITHCSSFHVLFHSNPTPYAAISMLFPFLHSQLTKSKQFARTLLKHYGNLSPKTLDPTHYPIIVTQYKFLNYI